MSSPPVLIQTSPISSKTAKAALSSSRAASATLAKFVFRRVSPLSEEFHESMEEECSEAGDPPLPPAPAPARESPPTTSSQVDRDKRVGEPSIPRGLPAHVYIGKGFGRVGFNSATYGGIDPWLAKRAPKGRGGGSGDG